MTDKPKPDLLYKFRSWNDDYHKTLLTEGKLWIPSASDLNDPFDCCIPPRYDLVDRPELIKRINNLLPKGMSRKEKRKRTRIRIKELGVRDPRRLASVLGGFAQDIQRQHAVLSFTEGKKHPLLWSHYADSYRGFCIGLLRKELEHTLNAFFNYTDIAFQDGWIKYEDEMPKYIPTIDEEDDFDLSVRMFRTKSRHWDYEDEYRYVFIRKGGYAIPYPSAAVSEIILGSQMPETHRNEIIELAKQKYPNACLMQAQRKPFEFELEFLDI